MPENKANRVDWARAEKAGELIKETEEIEGTEDVTFCIMVMRTDPPNTFLKLSSRRRLNEEFESVSLSLVQYQYPGELWGMFEDNKSIFFLKDGFRKEYTAISTITTKRDNPKQRESWISIPISDFRELFNKSSVLKCKFSGQTFELTQDDLSSLKPFMDAIAF